MKDKKNESNNRAINNLNRTKYEIAQEFGISHREEIERKKKQ